MSANESIGGSNPQSHTKTLILTIIHGKNTPVVTKESNGEILEPHLRKKSENRYFEEDNKNSFTLLMSHLSQGGTAQCQESPPWPMIYPVG